ncbi:peptidoglycan editing factor PgeF [Thiomicrorhabdus sp. Kp2]|uniref:peptidoglycan editing factor PgeF n=1 Tax=Thiomicrorhabdus sp. Kp2 TaxID=1123518 RepID=UPI00040F6578|nr:peptidoglycan editing factor PgeF [Thiomicrorhabdus sp. Kp2]
MFISPNWPVPKNIKAFCTTRKGGESKRPFDSFNLATHVEDDLNTVLQNRQLLQEVAHLPSTPIWLNQQHTDRAISLVADSEFTQPPIADASWAQTPDVVCVVMTADCLPILITDMDGTCVAAIHAGWKGLADRIVSKTIKDLPVEPEKLMAWVGPAISQQHFEVGQDVFDAFIAKDMKHKAYFEIKEQAENKYLADLPGLVTSELNALGVNDVYQSGLCSYDDEEHFYSYRRDGKTGRMASLIWIEKPTE